MHNNIFEQNLTKLNIEAFQLDLVSWFQREQRELPWRENKDPYKIWVSEIMLQQTKVETVIPYFNRFIDQFPTLQALAGADEQEVLKAWEGLGYYSRARNLQAAVREVSEQYEGIVPNEKEELAGLRGVGPYTTGAILSIAYGKPEPAVDGNVMRVFSRIFSVWEDIAKSSTRKIFEKIVSAVMYEKNPSDFNQAIMELGAIVCTPKSPSCLLCPIQEHCQAFKEGNQQELPVKAKKKAPREIYLSAIVLENEKKEVFIQKRDDKGLLANLWEFPNHEYTVELDNRENQLQRFLMEKYKIRANGIHKLTDVKHVFSHIVWNITVFKGSTNEEIRSLDGQAFVSKEKLQQYPFSVAHQKIINFIQQSPPLL